MASILSHIVYIDFQKYFVIFGNLKNSFGIFRHPSKYFEIFGHPKNIFEFLDKNITARKKDGTNQSLLTQSKNIWLSA